MSNPTDAPFEISADKTLTKRALATIFSQSLTAPCSIKDLANALGLDVSSARALARRLASSKLVDVTQPGLITLTRAGRKKLRIVLAGGVFDIIHSGHIYTLMKAKSLGDVLIVSVARDATVQRLRGKPSIHNEDERAELVASIRYVDAAVLGSTTDPLGSLWEVKPDIVAIGYDQNYDEKDLQQKATARGLHIVVKRMDSPVPGIKSSEIKKDRRIMHSF